MYKMGASSDLPKWMIGCADHSGSDRVKCFRCPAVMIGPECLVQGNHELSQQSFKLHFQAFPVNTR